jgi:hypothetical protein
MMNHRERALAAMRGRPAAAVEKMRRWIDRLPAGFELAH